MNLDPTLAENMKRQRCPVVPRGSPKTEITAAGLVKRPLKFRVARIIAPANDDGPDGDLLFDPKIVGSNCNANQIAMQAAFWDRYLK